MSSKINPSPALIARADTTLSDCVKMMNEHHIGSILIVSEQGAADLVGIITERDLLTQFQRIIDQKLWSRPVREVMTSPVATLDISQLNQAAEIMLRRNFRHVPVTLNDTTQSRQILAGIISMRDLFKSFVKESSGRTSWLKRVEERSEAQLRRLVGVYSKDGNFSAFLTKMFHDFALGHVSSVDFSKAATLHADVLIIDLDGLEVTLWTQYLKKLNQDPEVKAVVVVFDPSKQAPDILLTLERIGQSDKFSIFRKPINILSFFEEINTLGQSSEV